jgi:glycosyltransferase involved in cell wall biosynthesis
MVKRIEKVKTRLKIGINASMLDDHPTGVGVYSFQLINNLAAICQRENKYDLTVFSPSHYMLDKNIRIKKLPAIFLSSKYGKLAAIARFLWNCFYYPLVSTKFDLLLSPTTHGNFTSSRQIITIHDLLSLRYTNILPHQRFYFQHLLPFLLKKSKLIVTVSENTKKDIVSFFNYPAEKIHVVHNGYDPVAYHAHVQNNHQILNTYRVSDYLLAIGPTYPHKNFELLIEAYSELDISIQQRHPLVIAGGKEDYLTLLKTLVKSKGLETSIFFIGYVPIELMPSLYKEAVALVFPSIYEGFGIPLLEAMATGCPVIVSNSSSMPEVCGAAALYFDPLQKESLKSSVQALLDSQLLRRNLIKKGLERSKDFSWNKMAEHIHSIIANNLLPINN